MKKITIFGFGRIGRQLLRIALDKKIFVPHAVADVKELKTLGALFAVDTNYGRWLSLVPPAKANAYPYTIGLGCFYAESGISL
ncbi:glyceraldehyde 3-phosphate dehydrogenase NAD-binding domain-containing protein [Mucilaginibacter terrae]|uniref:Glyceraldehyde-3-phosphate dehydrogenase/erythrose-4-phosphate dehydrogenase n=1 Tax=Mucilaginibacter terrae TaxID=1955052 RepID=A0ABU3GQG9_9SPHI|nr:glyceraldehyde 3-phosphate dehydrogenase NAD-binding domain-containing protein [Mucilaginibacter terrae]MDT3402012.1 glyceraldehyde-3-phosphate dehydrogenase/erythrose-4-phosphate dehydrogenase [Mucilaginibacter terrae]